MPRRETNDNGCKTLGSTGSLPQLTCALLATPAAAQNNAAFDRGYREGIQQARTMGETAGSSSSNATACIATAIAATTAATATATGIETISVADSRPAIATGTPTCAATAATSATIGSIRAVATGSTTERRDGLRGYQDPAFARGYSDGWEKGLDDGRDRDRYDPVRHGDYKDADNGYERSYGSKDAYENNYRSGFRQGYEAGYRDRGTTAGNVRSRSFGPAYRCSA